MMKLVNSPKKPLYPFFSKSKNYHTPLLMGVLNITPDSFFDGGAYMTPSHAIRRAEQLQDEGADIIDIGAESSRPGACYVSVQDEWRRLRPVLKQIRHKIKIKISIDTSKYEIMKRALDEGVDIINDIYAMRQDERTPHLIAKYSAGIVLMHMRGNPQTMQTNTRYKNMFHEIITFLNKQTLSAIDHGINPDAVIVDPGIGFGKSVNANFKILAGLEILKEHTSRPLLVGISNKSFIKKIALKSSEEIRVMMAALHGQLMFSGADILRVHDIMDAISVRTVYRKMIKVKSAINY